MAKKPETLFKDRVRPRLEALPHSWWLKLQLVSICGIPDFLGCLNGHFIAIELKKSLKDPPRKLQAWVLQKIVAAGGIGMVLCPENEEMLFTALEHLAKVKGIYKSKLPDLQALDS